MKYVRRSCIAILISLVIYNFIRTCPTCIGQVNQNTPPFFSDDLYNKKQDATDITDYEFDEKLTAAPTESYNFELEEPS